MPVSKEDVIIIDKDFIPKNAEDVFYKYKAEIIDALTKNLIHDGKDQPGVLLQSIDVHITSSDSRISFALQMEDYWKFVDQGRRKGAKMPPQKAMLDFIKVAGLKLNSKKITVKTKGKKIDRKTKQISRDASLKQLAFLIGRGIKRHGIKPTNFFTNVINNDLKERMKKDLSIALKKDIEIDFKESIKK